jgi:hypothetical protein
MKFKKLFRMVLIAAVVLSASSFLGASKAQAAIITCGRGQDMCTLCDLIKGMKDIIDYLMKISIGVALLVMAIAGVMYIVSAGDKGLAGKAKAAMTNAAIGFVVIFAAYLIINTTITYIGTRKNNAGVATFGMNITSWGNFDCTAMDRGGN